MIFIPDGTLQVVYRRPVVLVVLYPFQILQMFYSECDIKSETSLCEFLTQTYRKLQKVSEFSIAFNSFQICLQEY